jgi:hypothetical protein
MQRQVIVVFHVFPELSIRLPSLSNFSLINCNRVKDGEIYYKDYHNIVTEMSNTFLGNLVWAGYRDWNNVKPSFGGICLRIDTFAKAYYYPCNKDSTAIEPLDGPF